MEALAILLDLRPSDLKDPRRFGDEGGADLGWRSGYRADRSLEHPDPRVELVAEHQQGAQGLCRRLAASFVPLLDAPALDAEDREHHAGDGGDVRGRLAGDGV